MDQDVLNELPEDIRGQIEAEMARKAAKRLSAHSTKAPTTSTHNSASNGSPVENTTIDNHASLGSHILSEQGDYSNHIGAGSVTELSAHRGRERSHSGDEIVALPSPSQVTGHFVMSSICKNKCSCLTNIILNIYVHVFKFISL